VVQAELLTYLSAERVAQLVGVIPMLALPRQHVLPALGTEPRPPCRGLFACVTLQLRRQGEGPSAGILNGSAETVSCVPISVPAERLASVGAGLVAAVDGRLAVNAADTFALFLGPGG